MNRQNLVLDAMGVIYRSCDDVAELLVPFVQRQTNIDARKIEKEYHSASLGRISSVEFWNRIGLDNSVEDEYLGEHGLTPGLLEFLGIARKHVDSIWCLSNDVSEWSRKLRNRFNIERLFDGFVISGDVGLRKPDVNIFNRFLEISGLLAEGIVFVDDRPKNVEAASAVGISSLLFGEEMVGAPNGVAQAYDFDGVLAVLRS